MKDQSGKAGCSLARSPCARLTRTLNLIPVNMERNIQPRERETWGGLGRECGILEMSLWKLRGNGLEESEGLVKALGQVL